MLTKSKKDLIKKVDRELRKALKGKSKYNASQLRSIIYLVKQGRTLPSKFVKIARKIRIGDQPYDDDDVYEKEDTLPTPKRKKNRYKSINKDGKPFPKKKESSLLREIFGI